jgi:tetratricopeptide (TPR) repeat protein
MAKKRKKGANPKPKKRIRSTPDALLEGLAEVDQLTYRRRWAEALEELQALDQRYPNRPEVLTELVNVCYELNNIHAYQLYIYRLSKLRPNDPDLLFGLAGAYLTNIYPALALRTYRQFLARYPDHERAEDVHQIMADLEPSMAKVLADLELQGEDALELAAQHDEVRAALEMGQFREARKTAKLLLSRHPHFAPVHNNLSQVDFAEGRIEQAIATAHHVLSFEPDNFQALSNLTRYLYLSGQTEAARKQAERLKQVESKYSEVWVKKAEAFTYLGDDQEVLKIFAQAEQSGDLKPPLPDSMLLLYHFAAVAAMRLGDEKQARQYWQQVLKLNPHFNIARENLTDLDGPIEQRHAPWPFHMRQWISQRAVDDMIKEWLPALQRDSEEAMTRAARHYLRQHPEMVNLVPLLLERGDPPGRKFALDLAAIAETPELLAALKDFALSHHGPDDMRHRAGQIASEAGLLPFGPTRMWLKGEWREILFLGFEIYDEPVAGKQAPHILRRLRRAVKALHEGKANEAERLLKRALEMAPETPDILNNLAMAYAMQGRTVESEALARQIHQDHPDYFFGIIAVANLHVQEGRLDQAEELLKPLLSQKRLHTSEFKALCQAYLNLYLAKDMLEAAQTWFNLWADIDPDDHELNQWRLRLTLAHKSGKRGR